MNQDEKIERMFNLRNKIDNIRDLKCFGFVVVLIAFQLWFTTGFFIYIYGDDKVALTLGLIMWVFILFAGLILIICRKMKKECIKEHKLIFKLNKTGGK